MAIKRFEEIEAWQIARELTHCIHRETRSTALREDPDLRHQMRRSAVSVMANIAEGFDAGTDLSFARYLRIARASASELQSHLYVCLDEGFIPKDAFQKMYDLAANAKRRLCGFIQYLKQSSSAK